MSFLNPALLWGLAAVAVPVIIHLIFRRQVQRVVWAAMRFLQASVVRHRQRLRVEDWLLLLLRGLLVAALAVALARPASRGAGVTGPQPVVAVLVLDHSASMGHSDGVVTRFEQARQLAEQIVDELPTGSTAALLLAADTVTALVAEPTPDRNLLRKLIREAPLTDRATNLLPAFQRAVAALEHRATGRREIICLTDRTALAWRQSAEIQKLLEPRRATLRARVIFVGNRDEENLAVTGLRLASGLAAADQPVRVEVDVTNYGRAPRADVPVRVSVAGQPPADEAVLETVPPGATRSVALFAKLPGAGHHPVTARVPNDRLAADDERVMVVAARQRFDVLLVEGQPARAAQERAAFFLQQALQPVARAAAAGFFVQVGTVTLAELDAARLEEFDAVVLADAPGLPARAALEQYLRRGGGVVVFPGPGTRPEAYHQEWRELLPARLGAVRAAPPEQWFGLQPPPYEHPVVTLWNDPAAGTLESARFYRAYELTPADGARVVARFADGAPALVERAWGAGRVVLAASTANTAWNDLPVRPAFVPLLFRTLGWLGREQTSGLNVRVGENFVHRARDEQAGANVTVEPPATGAAARGLSRVEVVEGVPVAQFDRTDWSGTYRVRIESEPAAELAFAAQADPAESDLTPLSAAQEQALATVAELGVPDTVEAETVAAGPARGEWWWPVVLAALALAVTETVLGHWFSRAK